MIQSSLIIAFLILTIFNSKSSGFVTYMRTNANRYNNIIRFSMNDTPLESIIDLPERESYQEYLTRTSVKVQNKLITPPLLRNLQFTDVDGNKRKIVTKDKAIVVFLRQLGCPYCWSYIQKWCDRISELKLKDIEICFVSIGDKSNLPSFLELNPCKNISVIINYYLLPHIYLNP